MPFNAIKKRLFRNKPYKDANGIYTYSVIEENVSNPSEEYNDSDGVPKPYDKFQHKDLFSNLSKFGVINFGLLVPGTA